MGMQMIQPSLPLYELFTRLRQAGLPLGIDEYQEFLRALQGGFGILNRTALARLCKTLWVKSSEEEHLFDYHFEQIIPPFAVGESPTSFVQPSAKLETGTNEYLPEPAAMAVQEQLREASLHTLVTSRKTGTSVSASAASDVVVGINDEVQVAQAFLQSVDETSYFIQTVDYFPITRRQMKQSWRYLRRPTREGPPIEVDIEATVNLVGQQGMLLEPVLVPRRINGIELLLLLDQGGSMIPFHLLSIRLAETALRGGRLSRTSTYYFHNCPVEYLYHDSAQVNSTSIQEIADRLHHRRTGILIFSDAGAARGGLSRGRVEMTEEFINQLNQHVRYIAWLNPMPHSRWYGTTAEKIGTFVPMFDLSRRGLDNAISILRGRLVSNLERGSEV
jgi:uncharacterized protein